MKTDISPWFDAMLFIAKSYRLTVSEERIKISTNWAQNQNQNQNRVLENMARQMGLSFRKEAFNKARIDPWQLPLIAELEDGKVVVIQKSNGKGMLSVLTAGSGGALVEISMKSLIKCAGHLYILRPLSTIKDARIDEYIKPYEKNWFWQILTKDWTRYSDVALASVVANVLALSGIMFSMQIYDRVIPTQSESTLWVLFFGVLIAMSFELTLRLLRTRISDLQGKLVGLRMSDLIFGRALRIRNEARSKSTGTFIAQIRELDQVKELFTSTTVGVLTDLPFVLLFIAILFFTGGSLVWVVIAAIPILLLPGFLAQATLARLSTEGMRESAVRNALLVEAVDGIEDIKLLRAEDRFQNQWNQMQLVSADIGIRQRYIINGLITWAQQIQTAVYSAVLLVGSYLVISGDITTGVLVGTSILASRTLAPITQVAGILARWQQAKVARASLDELMNRPLDHPEGKLLVHRQNIRGNFALDNVVFKYSENDVTPAFWVENLKIKAGEKIALVGAMGAGKSTLLHLLSGMYRPQSGGITLDELNIGHFDPADVRRDVAYLSQRARLFFGSIRDNVTLGMPTATDEEITEALRITGALPFVKKLPDGLNHMVLEGGRGLSGGQQQSLLIARTIISKPQTLLLDEPTASLDEVYERHIIKELDNWLGDRTLIVATHRMPIVQWADRVLVVENGTIVKDGQIKINNNLRTVSGVQ